MRTQRRGMRNLGSWLLAASVLSGGCLSICHPTGEPSRAQIGACGLMPPTCRNHVYIFLVNGVDPLCYGNLAGLRDYVQSLGFIKTYYGQLYHGGTFAKEICRLHSEDAEARFVLIGFNHGAGKAHDLAHAVHSAGVHVDLLVYLDGSSVETKPENVGRLVNIKTKERSEEPMLDDAVNITYTDAWYFAAPSHRYTLELMAQELTAVAGMVPTVDPHTAPPGEKTPAKTMPRAEARDDWDFLKPRSPYGEAPSPQSQPKPKQPAPPLSSVGKI